MDTIDANIYSGKIGGTLYQRFAPSMVILDMKFKNASKVNKSSSYVACKLKILDS